MGGRTANLQIGVQALRTFLSRGRVGEEWAEAMQRLDLNVDERRSLSELLGLVTLPSYISPASLSRLRLNHQQATIVGTATVVYATYLLLGGGRGPDDGEDDRVPSIAASIPRITSMLTDDGTPDPTRLRARLALVHRVARGEASLPALESPELDASPNTRAPTQPSPPPGHPESSGRSVAGLRVAGRNLPRVDHRDPTESLHSCLFALRAWARGEGMDHAQLARAIRSMNAGAAEKDAFRRGFGSLLLPLSNPSPTAVLDAELDQSGLRALGIGVVVYGRLVLSRYERMRSALALSTMRGRPDQRLQAGVDRDVARLEGLESYVSLLLPRVEPGPAGEDRVYPGLLLLRDGIEEALRPSVIEEIAQATVSGSMPAVSLDAEGTVSPPSKGVTADPRTALRPTLGLALHGLDLWSRGGTFLPAVDAAIRSTDFPPGLRTWFERGSNALSKLPPDFDPVALADAELDDTGMMAAGMGTLVYSALVRASDPEEFPDLDDLRAEVAEFATYLVLCLNADSSPMHARVVQQLLDVRRRFDEDQGARTSSKNGTEPKRRQVRRPAVSAPRPALPALGSPPVALRLLGVAVAAALVLGAGLRYWNTRGPPPPATYQDIVEVLGMVRAGSDVTVRIQYARLGDTSTDRTEKATTLWSRLAEEANDPELTLRIQSETGRPIATVANGSVTWSDP